MAAEAAREAPESLESVYDRLAPSLFRYALILLADHHEAEDVIQHVFAVLVKRGTRGVDSLDRYLRVSVRNECYTALTRRRSDRVPVTSNGALLDVIAATDERPDERLAIEQGLRQLPPEQREVVHLKVFDGHSFQEIADLSGESINTVASRYRYAIDKLKHTFGVRSA